ncbi:MAG: glucose-1-phosphate thymidylyltransferase RfbA [Bdellovibrionaceae bacterium]|nr:glucose-1-phosphate thymidylyltransferase RfbA [Pseudobdellovibrionaceae bacterium]
MKGIVLAGGSGTRLYPATKVISKQLLPIYNKPMVYYPISVLMLAGIQDILLISTPHDIGLFERLLGNGHQFGINISYAIQERPEGLAQAFLIAEKFIDGGPSTLVLGDNIFYGHNLSAMLQKSARLEKGACIYGYYVDDPERYGVAELDDESNVLSIEEKPTNPKSNYAVTGLYFYDNTVVERVKTLKPSSRGELEISSLNNLYLADNELKINILGRGMAWLDTGTHASLIEASNYIQILEKTQGLQVACLEEVGFKMGYLSKEDVLITANQLKNSTYGDYLLKTIHEDSC